MGCYQSQSDDFELNDTMVSAVERSLQIGKKPYKQVHHEVLKYCSGDKITPRGITPLCEALNIPHNSPDAFLLNSFKDRSTNTISNQKIKTLHVLLSPGTKAEKVSTLFLIYDIKETGVLSEENVREMVTDIYEISVQSLVNLTLFCNNESRSESLTRYCSKMNRVKTTVIFYLFHHFADGREELDSRRFRKIFYTIEMNILIVPKLLRKFCFKVAGCLESEGFDVQKQIELDEAIYMNMMKKFNTHIASVSVE